jgi:hypothetical protein
MTPIKLGITGVHGAGKSRKVIDLMEHCLFLGNKVIVVDEVARKCPYALGSVSAQEYIWHNQMMREKHAMAQDVDVIITDRIVLDNLIYYRAIIEDPANLHDWQTNFFRWLDLYQEAKAWMPTYAQVIRMPLNLEWLQAEDDIRPKSIEYARRIDRLFDQFVDKFVTQWGNE